MVMVVLIATGTIMASLKLTKNADGTITVRAGKYIETISTDSKGPYELLDCIRWAAITAGMVVDEGFLWEQVTQLNLD